jgi:hypothetical protein
MADHKSEDSACAFEAIISSLIALKKQFPNNDPYKMEREGGLTSS